MKAAVSLYEFMPYGAPELLQSRRERMARALVLASALMVVLYAAAGAVVALMASAPVRVPQSIHITIVPPPPPLIPTLRPEIVPPVATKIPIAAIPIPVPDATIPNGQTSPAQRDMLDVAPQPAAQDGGLTIPLPAGDTLPTLGEYVYVEELPVPIREVTPTYPDVAREAGVEGVVMVNVLVGRDGRVIEARLETKRQVPMLNDASLAAARLWVFKPALANNRPVAVWTAIPFNFRLH